MKHLKASGFCLALGLAALAPAARAAVSSADNLGTNWVVTPTYATYPSPDPMNNPAGAFVTEGNWGTGGLAQGLTLNTAGTLNTLQLTMGGTARTFNIFLYDLGPSAGYLQGGGATFVSGVSLFSPGLQFAYGGGASSVSRLTFSGVDAVSLLANEYYAFVMEPTTTVNNDTFWLRGGATPNPGGQAYRQSSPGNYGALNGAVREFGLAATVPEPGTAALLGMSALLGIFRFRRHHRQ